LAVVLPDGMLPDGLMQQIAREFGYSETTFVLPPTGPASDATVRIFTPRAELPFAGHPNVGTALVLAAGSDRLLRFDEGAGLVEVQVTDGLAEVAAPVPHRVLGSAEPAAVARACGLTVRHLAATPVVATAGVPFVLAPVASQEVLAEARPVSSVTTHGAAGILLYTGADPIRARMFAPALGVPEDPATGAAALALAGFLAASRGAGRWLLHQGAELGRPAQLHARADGTGRTWVAGRAVPMMAGELLVPAVR
jgi:trans-2,3-dihydro-3-hydroxyanthranilate isomerase